MKDNNKNILTIEQVKERVKSSFLNLFYDDDSHSYKFAETPLKPVSEVYKGYVDEPDFNKIAGFVAKSRGVTKEEVLEEWREKGSRSSRIGKDLHSFAESYYISLLNPSNGYEEAFCKFWDNLPKHLVPVAFELKMFSTDLGIAGTCDLLLYNTLTGKFVIVDYKTNEDLFKNFKGKTLIAPFEFLLDSPLNRYKLQLSLYHLLFEQTGFEVEGRIIVWIKPDGTYEEFHTENYSEILLNELVA